MGRISDLVIKFEGLISDGDASILIFKDVVDSLPFHGALHGFIRISPLLGASSARCFQRVCIFCDL